MGTIAQVFESGKQGANEGLFKNLVMLTKVDGKVDDSELELLKIIAKRLSLTDEQVQEIVNHPDDYPMIPPVSKVERYERFIQFIEMTYVDGVIDPKERELLLKYGIQLGYHEDEANKYADSIIEMVKKGMDSDEILSSLD